MKADLHIFEGLGHGLMEMIEAKESQQVFDSVTQIF